MGYLIQLIVTGLSLLGADYLLDSISIDGFKTALIAAIVLGVVNTFLRPILRFFFAGITFITFGLFSFVINAITYKLTSVIVPGFDIAGFWGAVIGAVITSVIATVLSIMVRRG